jgi:hypothetical protein
MNVIKFSPPTQVRIGAGAMWKQVLEVVNPNKYTMVHGQVKMMIFPFV